jgi:hypothetical protein
MATARPILIASALVLALAACGNDPESKPAATSAGAPAPGDGTTAGDGTADATRDMVAGVTAAKGAGLVDLKFKVEARPELGQPLVIDVAFLPNVASDLMRATFISTEGLSVRSSEVPADYERVQAGAVYRHQLTVVPRDNGVYFVSAIISMQTPTGDVTRTFSIPVVVGAPSESEAAVQAP